MTGELVTRSESEALEHAYLLGLSRATLPVPAALRAKLAPEAVPLAALALTTQRVRFDRPEAAKERLSCERLLPEDPRPILPPALRAQLARLLATGERGATEGIAPALFGLISARGLRLHPFDLPRLEAWLRKAEDRLGRGEQAYLAHKRDKAEVAPAAAFHLRIADDNWHEFPKRERLAYLRERRATDPGRARELIAAALLEAAAPLRAELLQVLGLRLGAEDRPVLEGSAGDRAAGVREIAQKLLARLPGTPAYNERVKAAVSAFSRGRAGLLRQRAALVFTPPGKSGKEQDLAIAALLEGVALADLAAGVDLSPEEFVAALPASYRALHLAVLRILLSEGRIELVGELAKVMVEAEWVSTLAALEQELAQLSPAARRSASEAIYRAQPVATLPPAPAWLALESLRDGPFSPELAAELLGGAAWRNFVREAEDAEGAKAKTASATLLAIAALIPAALTDRLIAALAPLPQEITAQAMDYARFAQALAAIPGGDS